MQSWVLQSVSLGAAIELVECAVEAVVLVDVASFVCNLGRDGLW